MRIVRASFGLVLGVLVGLLGPGVGSASAWTGTVTLSVDKSVIETDEWATLTADISAPLSGSYAINIYNSTLGSFVQACFSGTSCQAQVNRTLPGADTYVAYVSDFTGGWPASNVQATSNTEDVELADYEIDLTASKSVVTTSELSDLEASLNQPPAGGYALLIWNETSDALVQMCYAETCEAEVGRIDEGSDEYVAYLTLYGNAPTSGDLASDSKVVSLLPFEASISPSVQTASTDDVISVTATVNQSIAGTSLAIAIYDEDEDQVAHYCWSGDECVYEFTNKRERAPYRALVVPPSTPVPSEARASSTVAVIEREQYRCVVEPEPTLIASSLNWYSWVSSATFNQTITGTGLKYFTDIDGANIANQDTGHDATGGWGTFSASPGQIRVYVAEVDSLGNPTRVLAWCGAGVPGRAPLLDAGGGNPSTPDCQRCDGDPINTASGMFFLAETDLEVAGRGPALRFTRTFATERAPEDGPLGHGWTHNYAMRIQAFGIDAADLDGASTLIVRQENGSQVLFERDSNGDFETRDDVRATLVEEVDGSFTFVRRGELTFRFSSSGRLTEIEDLNGYQAELSYDSAGQLETVTDEAGRDLTLTYTNGRLVEVEDPAGRTVEFSYDGGDLVSAVDAAGHEHEYGYNVSHWMTTLTDGRGKVTSNAYDRMGRVYRQTDPLARELDFTYGRVGDNLATTVTDDDGNATEHVYEDGRLISETRGAGTSAATTTQFTYDAAGNVATRTDGAGKTWSFEHDANGNMLSATDPLNREQVWTYNAQNRVLTHTTAEGVTTTNTWDSSGNLLTSSTPVTASGPNAVTQYTYGDSNHPGDVTAITDAEGGVTELTWSAAGDLVVISDPNDRVTTRTFNAIGWKLTEVSPRGNLSGATPEDFETTWTYDGLGHVLSVTDPLGRSTSSTYDGAGNLATATASNSEVTAYTYDDASQLVKVTRPDASSIEWTYNSRGLVTSEKDGNGKTTSFAYNAAGLRASKTDPLSRVTSYSHDAAGRLHVSTDPLDRTITYAYDDAGQLTGIDYEAASTPDVTFAYDDDGRRVSMVDGSGTSTYQYDGLGHLVTIENGASVELDIDRDKLGNIVELEYPGSGRSVTYTYDDAGHMTSATDWLSGVATFGYDANGNWTDTTYPNGVTASSAFNRAGQVTSIEYEKSSMAFASFSQAYGPAGMLGSVTSTGVPSNGTQSYDYDELQRLDTVTNGLGAGAYAFDGAGNQTTVPDGTFAYDDARQASSFTPTSGTGTTYSFNDLGERLSATTGMSVTGYEYDQAGRLVEYTNPSSNVTTYAYDGDGTRTSVTASSVTREHTWLPNGNLPMLLDDDQHAYIYGPGGTPISQIDTNDDAVYLHGDHLGSIRSITDDTGTVVGTASYGPYGTPSSTGTVSRLGFAGQYTDAESGLQYLRARYYDPATGQFLTRDPIEDVTGDPYGYANGNPIMNTDPTGLFAQVVAQGARWALPRWGVPAGEALGFGAVGTGAACWAGYCPGEFDSPFTDRDNLESLDVRSDLGQCEVYMAKSSKKSGKERASDRPTIARQNPPMPGESRDEYLERIYGPKADRSPGSDYSKTKKWWDRR